MRRSVIVQVYLWLLVAIHTFDYMHSRIINNHGITKRRTAITKSGEPADKNTTGYLIFDNKQLETIASIASETGNFYLAAFKCCSGKNEETCLLTTEATNIAEDMEQKSFEINEIVRQTKNLETVYLGTFHEFKLSVMAMHRIVQALEVLLESLDSSISNELNKASQDLKRMCAEKNSRSEKMDFVTIETLYFKVLDKVLYASMPNFAPIIPSIPKLQLFIKSLLGRYKTLELGQTIQPPDNSSEQYQASKSWFGKQTSIIESDTDEKQKQIQAAIGESFIQANCVKKAFIDLNILAREAYKLYKKYAMSTQCNGAYDKAKNSIKKLRKAKTKLAEVFKGVFISRNTMSEAGAILRKLLASQIFLNDLIELKGALQLIVGDGTDKEFQRICDNIGSYIDNIKNQTFEMDPTFTQSFALTSDLRASLVAVPEYLKCYSRKARVVRAVLEGCKKGDGSLKYLNQQASRFYEEATDSCERKIGVAPFADRKLQSYIDERSKEQNFSNICEANNKVTASLVCNEYCEGTEKDQLPELFEVPMKVVDTMMKSCKCDLTDKQKASVCLLVSKRNTAQQILDTFPDGRFTLKQIENVDCSAVPVTKVESQH